MTALSLEEVDPGPDVGSAVRLVVGPDGAPHLFYTDARRRVAYHAYRTGDQWVREEIRRSQDIGPLVVGILTPATGAPAACWPELGAIECAVESGSAWPNTIIQTGTSLGTALDAAADLSGRIHVVYFDFSSTLGQLNHAVWDPESNSLVVEGVDGGPSTGESLGLMASIGIQAREEPVVAYYDESLGNLRYARWNSSTALWEKLTVEWKDIQGETLSLLPEPGGDPDCPNIGFTATDAVALLAHPSDAQVSDTTVYERGVPVDGSRFGFCTPQKLIVRAANGAYSYRADYIATDTSPEDDGREASLWVGRGEEARVAYLDWDDLSIRYATHVTGDWTWETADAGGRAGNGLSLALDPASQVPAIAFQDTLAKRLLISVKRPAGWEACVADVRPGSGERPSLVWSPADGFDVAYLVEPRLGERSLWFARLGPLQP